MHCVELLRRTLINQFVYSGPTHSSRCTASDRLLVSAVRLSIGRSFHYTSSPSLSICKQRLKTYLFELSYPNILRTFSETLFFFLGQWSLQ
jgi:hypothetical protein